MKPLGTLNSLAALAVVAVVVGAIGGCRHLVISNAPIAPDGFTREAVVVNGVSPAPLITGKKGNHTQLNVIDKLTKHTMLNSTSIHWHGFFQAGTNWADGPAFVNQCPIATGHSFLYDFHVRSQAGTFWYHSHLQTQYCDGLSGPPLQYDPHLPQAHLYHVDNESTVITLSDWYHVAARLGPPFPRPICQGRHFCPGNHTEKGPKTAPVIPAQHGKRYRFRLVSLSCDPNHNFSIDGHNMKNITGIHKHIVGGKADNPGNIGAARPPRHLNANQTVNNYWIRANPSFGTTGFAGGINSAILRYNPPGPGHGLKGPLLNLTGRHLFPGPPAHHCGHPGLPTPGGVDKPLNLAFNFNGSNFFINNASFTPPTVPVLLLLPPGSVYTQILSGAHTAQELPGHSSIEITMPATSLAPGAPHPFHLHGHAFAVVRSAGSTEYNYTTGTPAAGDDDPIFRDVVNVTIRFRTDNPGPWFLHCHIDFHLDAGFAVVFAPRVAYEDVANPVPYDALDQAWSDLCPIVGDQ
uniref:laccase n=1 Tax=Grifola frondosa TaxID=5627 RepID=W5S2N8_GRIFR|nr:laccase 1 [Grifola frondosa]